MIEFLAGALAVIAIIQGAMWLNSASPWAFAFALGFGVGVGVTVAVVLFIVAVRREAGGSG